MSATIITIKRALLSVSDKTGLVEFAQKLVESGIELLSTGGTASLLKQKGIPVTDVSAYTEFPEIMGGRVKTLHPKIHGGILRRPGVDDDVLAEYGIDTIDMVVVNLYPFAQAIANAPTDLANAIENIDIGGPTMVRAAAKNYMAVSVVVDPQDYPAIIAAIQQQGGLNTETRFNFAKKAFAHTAQYDATIANFLTNFNTEVAMPTIFNPHFIKSQALRYGENPHQAAAFYQVPQPAPGSVTTSLQLQGKELSFNNIADADTALECVKQFTDDFACVIVKHANPCGVALASTQQEAYLKAFATDPTSAFGGIIAFNRPLDEATAKCIVEQQFVEVIIAPEVAPSALLLLAQKPNVRVLASGQWPSDRASHYDLRTVNGGLLVQSQDLVDFIPEKLQVVTNKQPLAQEMHDLLFAWRVAHFVKSNAIVYTKNGQTLGIGAGQMSRVDSTRIAQIKAEQAKLDLQGSVLASDAFFPFRDSIDAAAKVGVVAIIQPGGSLRDQEIIQAANEAGIAMVLTGIRHFRH